MPPAHVGMELGVDGRLALYDVSVVGLVRLQPASGKRSVANPVILEHGLLGQQVSLDADWIKAHGLTVGDDSRWCLVLRGGDLYLAAGEKLQLKVDHALKCSLKTTKEGRWYIV